jgi:predicted transcriptional regulator YdeE
MKKLLLILILLFLSGCSLQPPFGAGLTLDQKIDAQISTIKTLMETDKQLNGKYKQRALQIFDGVSYKVDEYETAKGEIGYIISMSKEDASGIYSKVVATGVQASDFQYDWKLILDKTATSTK